MQGVRGRGRETGVPSRGTGFRIHSYLLPTAADVNRGEVLIKDLFIIIFDGDRFGRCYGGFSI
jgi:hypothetical protein